MSKKLKDFVWDPAVPEVTEETFTELVRQVPSSSICAFIWNHSQANNLGLRMYVNPFGPAAWDFNGNNIPDVWFYPAQVVDTLLEDIKSGKYPEALQIQEAHRFVNKFHKLCKKLDKPTTRGKEP